MTFVKAVPSGIEGVSVIYTDTDWLPPTEWEARFAVVMPLILPGASEPFVTVSSPFSLLVDREIVADDAVIELRFQPVEYPGGTVADTEIVLSTGPIGPLLGSATRTKVRIGPLVFCPSQPNHAPVAVATAAPTKRARIVRDATGEIESVEYERDEVTTA